MDSRTAGTVRSVATQWWLKVNTKAVRLHPLDGASVPHVIRVTYSVNGTEYTKRKWIGAGSVPPAVGSTVTVAYDSSKPSRAKIL